MTSIQASGVAPKELRRITADYLALDRARIYRRLLVVRFGVLTLVALVVGLVVPGLSLYARWVPVGVFLTPPGWAWVVEVRLERRLARRLAAVDGTT